MKYLYIKQTLVLIAIFSLGTFVLPKQAEAVVAPGASKTPGEYKSSFRLGFDSAEPAPHIIKYTTDGTLPSCPPSPRGTTYSEALRVTETTTFKTMTCTSGASSAVAEFAYVFVSGGSGGGGSSNNPTEVPGGPTCLDDQAYCPPGSPETGITGATLGAPIFGNVLANGIAALTRDLRLGTSGTDVAMLQRFLISNRAGAGAHALAAAGATGYFGTLTQNAAIEFQKRMGITPSLGYIGPKTRARMYALTGVLPNGNTDAAEVLLTCSNGSSLYSIGASSVVNGVCSICSKQTAGFELGSFAVWAPAPTNAGLCGAALTAPGAGSATDILKAPASATVR